MALNANNIPRTSSGTRAPVLDEGAYPGRLIWCIDLGLQAQQPFQGQEKPPAYMIQTVYESSDEFMPDEDGNPDEEKPRFFWEDFPIYSLDQDKAKSTKRYYALDPNEECGGDWTQLIGKPVLIALTRTKAKNGNEYNNVGGTSAMRPKEAAKLPDLVNEPKVFDLDDPDIEMFLSLPKNLQDRIKENLNYSGSKLETLLKNYKPSDKKDDKEENPTKKSTVRGVKSGVDETASRGSSEDVEDDNGDDW
jgi:hypothetical protein